MKTWWPLLLLAVPILAVAQTTDRPDSGSNGIYRTLDADGNVVFTDNPPDKKRAEEVKVGPTNTMDSPPVERRAASRGDAPPEPPEPPDTGYEAVSITAPDAGSFCATQPCGSASGRQSGSSEELAALAPAPAIRQARTQWMARWAEHLAENRSCI